MANTYKNIVITPNTGSSIGDPTIVFSGGSSVANTDVYLRTYTDSNGTLSFEGSAGQLFSITNDLTKTIFAVNDVSGIPLVEVNVSSQQITFGQFYGNVGIGRSASNSSNHKLDVLGSANITGDLTVSGNVNFDNATLYVDAANNRVGINDRTPNTALCVTGIISSDAFYENPANITTSYTITTGRNAMSAGPITINSGVTITVPSNSTWTIV